MKPHIAKLWIKALRSGDYAQAQGNLRLGDKFCCLGVLCNLHAQAHSKIAAKERSKSWYLGQSGVLPESVREWAGIRSNMGAFTDGRGVGQNLAAMNDGGKNFRQIADVIERQKDRL